jgi:hypothetical protein
MYYVCLKYQNHKNGCSNFLINWQPNAELQNVGKNQFTILNVTRFQLEFEIIVESPLIKYSTHYYMFKDGWNK